jgi:hypothetical protein
MVMIDFKKTRLPPRKYGPYPVIASHPMRYTGIILKKHKVTIRFPVITSHPMRYTGIILKKRKVTIRFPKIKPAIGLNVFQQLFPQETQHSMLLGELLNPNGKHGCGDMFLQLFLEIVLDDPTIYLGDKDIWNVTVEKERYDIRIRNQNNSKIIILENKSNDAGDQPNQLYRYWYGGIYRAQYRLKNVGKQTFAKILYLSPSVVKLPEEQSKSRPAGLPIAPLVVPSEIIKTVFFPYEIVDWLEACMKKVEKKMEQSDMYYYLKQYRDFWRS